MRFVTGLIRRPMGWPPYRTVTNKRPVIYTLLRGVGDAAPYGVARYIAIFKLCIVPSISAGWGPPPYWPGKYFTEPMPTNTKMPQQTVTSAAAFLFRG